MDFNNPTNTGITFTDAPDIIPAGDYEVIVEDISKKSSKDNTTQMLDIKFRIRTDVEQSAKNRVVYDRLFKDRTNPEWFDLNKLKTLVMTQSTGRGWQINFDTCDDCIQWLIGKNMKITLETVNNERTNYEDKTQVAYLSYKPTEHKPTGLAAGEPEFRNTDAIAVDDSDLPF